MEWYELWLCADTWNKTVSEELKEKLQYLKFIKSSSLELKQSFPCLPPSPLVSSWHWENPYEDGSQNDEQLVVPGKSSRCSVKNLLLFN